ncbi:MAG: DoxX family membrane protein [Nanoarchaeota archaeon]|nr:DoxX family membrane protein [Nanoarchaeota archaeon]
MMEKYKPYAPIVLRIALSLVFFWFSANQLMSPSDWTGFLPGFLRSSPTPETFIIANGIFEAVFGLLLLIGIWVRPVALLLALHLFAIVFTVGFNAVGVRDFGLAFATLAVFLNGPDAWCLMNGKNTTS